MKVANLSIKRPVTISMLMLAVFFVGLFAVTKLPEELFPTLNLPVAVVTTSWNGASPQAVEQQVTSPIEQALQSLSGVSEIDSTSAQNSSLVIVQFNYGVNLNEEVNQMRSIVSRTVNQLPSDAGTPEVSQFNPSNLPIMTLSLYGNQSQATISQVAQNTVQPALEHLNGVAAVNMAGNLTRQINVLVDPSKLSFYNLSINQVVQALQANNASTDAGQVRKGSLLVPLHVQGQFLSPNQLMNIPISTGHGASIPLSNVATVQDGFQDVSLISTVNGSPAVSLTITQATGANTVQVSNEVHQAVASLQSHLPEGVHLSILDDSAQTIRDTLHTMVTHTLLGFVFGILVMLLILRNLRTTLVIAVAIPIAVMATFMLMYLAGFSLNSITLGSLAVGLGSLVDFSIVVLESIFRARQTGLDAKTAASHGTSEVGLAVFVAALAQISVFAPSVFVPGIAGQFFRPLSMTVSFSHIAALFVAVSFTPMLASRLLKGRRFELAETIPGKTAPFRAWAPFDWFGWGMHALTQLYHRVLKWSLGHRKTVVLSAGLMLVLSYLMVPLIGFELVPNVGNGQISISVKLADGTDLQTTAQAVKRIESLAKAQMPGLTTTYAQIGSPGGFNPGTATNQATLTLSFNKNTSDKQLQTYTHQFQSVADNIAGAQITVTPGQASSGPGTGGVSVQIQGPDMNTLQILSQQVATIMSKTPGLEYVDNQLATGIPDYQLNINPAALAQYNLTEQQVESTLRTAFQGTNASTLYQNNNQYNIVVMLPRTYSENLNNLQQVLIQNSLGKMVPLSQIATLTTSQEPPQVQHVNGVRSVTVSATPYGVTSGRVQAELSKDFKQMRVPAGYTVGFGQNGQFLQTALIDLGWAVLFSIVLLYMVMASLFESLITPFVIMFSLPPTFIGAALGLLVTHRSLNIDSAIGVIMVIGLIANNAIVLVDYTNQMRAKGMPLHDALLHAGPIRLRPILMSTLTTVLAMMPLVIGGGTGGATLASMATVIAFGLTFSTLVTLVLVPVMYVAIDRWTQKWKGRFRRRTRPVPSSPSIGQ